MKTCAVFASALTVVSLFGVVAGAIGQDSQLARRAHRHVRRAPGAGRRRRRRAARCDGDSGESDLVAVAAAATASASAYAASASVTVAIGTQNVSASASPGSYPAKSLVVGNVYFGMLPDGGGDGGSKNTMAQLNSLVSTTGGTHATFGQYAQAHSGTPFDGSQLLQVMDDLKASGAIFEPAVMPTGGWQGLTWNDNSQAVRICNVMKKFTDEGIEVRLRFAHEVNYYLTDGTYSGTRENFLEGWDVVAKACRSIAPAVKMFFSPNVASLAEYDSYFPTDASTVDLIGIDYYPKGDFGNAFLTAMKPFHDKYASASTPFAIGETGLGRAGSAEEKMVWLKSIAAAKANGMPHLTSSSWFNYQKDNYSYKICDPNDGQVTGEYVAFLQGSA